MAEAGEAPVELRTRDRERLQGLAQNVVTQERWRGAPALDAVDRRRLDGAQQLARVGKWNEALQELQGDGREISRNLRSLIDKFGVTRDPATGEKRRSVPEAVRHTRARNALNALIPILETEGFDQMQPAEQAALRARVRTGLLANSRLPDFARMQVRQQDAVIDRFLRDPQLKQELFNVLTEVQGMQLTPETETIQTQKKTEVSRITREDANTKVTLSRADVQRAINRLNDIILNPTTADLGVQARLIREQITQNGRQLAALQTALPGLEAAIVGIPPQVPGPALGGGRMVLVPNPDYQRAQARITANETQQTQLQGDISNLIRERIGTVPTEESLAAGRNERFEEFGKARREEVEAQFDERGNRVAYQELTEQRRLEEENIATRLDEAFQRSLARYINNELRQSMEHFESNEGKVQGETMQAIKTEIARHFQSRWTMQTPRNRGIFRRRQNEPAINTAAVNRDFDRLLQAGNNGGVEPLMRDVLRRLRPVGDGNVRAAIPQNQINELMNNDAFAEEMRGELLKNVIARRAIIRPFRPGELYQMTNMPPVREAIKGAIETNGEFRTFVEETVGEDMEQNPQAFWNRFSREAWEQPGLFLFPVTTIPWSIWAGIRAVWRGRQNERRREAWELAA